MSRRARWPRAQANHVLPTPVGPVISRFCWRSIHSPCASSGTLRGRGRGARPAPRANAPRACAWRGRCRTSDPSRAAGRRMHPPMPAQPQGSTGSRRHRRDRAEQGLDCLPPEIRPETGIRRQRIGFILLVLVLSSPETFVACLDPLPKIVPPRTASGNTAQPPRNRRPDPGQGRGTLPRGFAGNTSVRPGTPAGQENDATAGR